MEVDKLIVKMTRQELLDHFTQEQIMEYYFGAHIKFKVPYANPFREDRTPGCTFFYTPKGSLLFHDFKLNAFYDCFQIADLRTGKDMRPSEIFEQMSNIPKEKVPKPQIKFNAEYADPNRTSIKVEIMPYEEVDLKFWNAFNIGIETLKKFNVRKVNKAWINGDLRYINTKKDPCYRYLEGERIKLYRPFSPKYKFRNNYNQELEGIKHLPEEGDILVITKSMKDIMVFDTIGVTAVCPRSETCLISEESMNMLFDRFKKVFIWYDTDNVGMERAKIIYDKYKEQGLIMIVHDSNLGKDTSDIVKTHGIDKLKELCKRSEIL